MTSSVESMAFPPRLVTALVPPAQPEPTLADTEFLLTVAIAQITHNLADDASVTGEQAMAALLGRIVEALPGTRGASLSIQPKAQKPPTTHAATEQLALDFDQLQYGTGQGPCLTAMGGVELVQVDDLASDERWPSLSRHARDRSPIRAVLSLQVTASDSSAQSLNLYAERPATFTTCHRPTAYLAAATVGLALTALRQRVRADHLRVALDTNRQIGAAMGILMARHRCSYDNAFTALRVTSQHLHRKLRDVADEVVFTGVLPTKPRRRPEPDEQEVALG
jgi:hypothetical protein